MPLHLVKLCVGVDEIADLASWQTHRLEQLRRDGQPEVLSHTTRQMPRRAPEILDGGSLYWVIRGQIQLRQPILALEPVTGADGISRCRIVLASRNVPTAPAPRRPFQGWRYLEDKDAPLDLTTETAEALPAALRLELADLGLL